MKITKDEYHDLRESNAGFCENCDECTADSGVEPDAQDYDCIVCAMPTVFGVEQALLLGYIEIEEP